MSSGVRSCPSVGVCEFRRENAGFVSTPSLRYTVTPTPSPNSRLTRDRLVAVQVVVPREEPAVRAGGEEERRLALAALRGQSDQPVLPGHEDNGRTPRVAQRHAVVNRHGKLAHERGLRTTGNRDNGGRGGRRDVDVGVPAPAARAALLLQPRQC